MVHVRSADRGGYLFACPFAEQPIYYFENQGEKIRAFDFGTDLCRWFASEALIGAGISLHVFAALYF